MVSAKIKLHENKDIFLKDYYKDLFLKDLIKRQFENRFNIVGIFTDLA